MKAPRVTLDQWRTLQAVVDHGGFAQAAEALHRSQSSVSYTVARMQEQLGVPLLRIDGRKAVLTEAGNVLLRRSRHLVKQASQLEDLAHHMEQGWEAEVRVVVDAAYPSARLVRALSAFMPQSRGCRVRLREEVLSGVEEVLREHLAPTKINLAALGNMVPHLHWHVIARFDWDSHFPSPVWAAAQRPDDDAIADFPAKEVGSGGFAAARATRENDATDVLGWFHKARHHRHRGVILCYFESHVLQ